MWCLLSKFSLEALINAGFLLNSSRRIYLFTSYTGEGKIRQKSQFSICKIVRNNYHYAKV